MARGDRSGRKPASDSTVALVRRAQTVDRSVPSGSAPQDVPGWTSLRLAGLNFYEQLYRERPDWTLGDLMLIVQAARCQEQIGFLELQMAGQPPILINPTTGGAKPNPILDMIGKLQLQVRNCLRDAGLRGKDGQAPTLAKPRSQTVFSSGDWRRMRVK